MEIQGFLVAIVYLEDFGLLKSDAGSKDLRRLMDTLYKKEWVVYIKEPMEGPAAVVEYIGNYTHRIAIANSRILNVDNVNKSVSFRWRDYGDNDNQKVMTLATNEFIRRFLLHVVPPGFMRIRHCGFMSCRARPAALARLRTVFKTMKVYTPVKNRYRKPWHELITEKTGKDPRVCKHCNVGIMRTVAFVEPVKREAGVIIKMTE